MLDIVNRFTELDAVSLNLASMMGLALGVDYSLLMVARFRREQAAGATVHEAATITLATAGRTVRFAGVVLALAMITALFLSPAGILLSAVVGVIAAVALSLLASYTVLPAALVFWSPHLDRWRLFEGAAGSEGWGRRAFTLIRRPGIAAAAVALVLLVLAAPALGLTTGPPDPRELPSSTTARSDFNAFRRAFGGAWTAPFEITVASRRGPITDNRRLRAFARFERHLRGGRLVLAEFGPGALERRTAALRSLPDRLDRGVRGIGRLQKGLGEAGSGAHQLVRGLAAAALAANQVAGGGSAGSEAARALQAGLARAMEGASRLSAGLVQTEDGTRAVIAGARRAARGPVALSAGLDEAASGVRGGIPQLGSLARRLEAGAHGLKELRAPARTAQQQLHETLSALDAMLPTSKLDPSYRRAYRAAARAYGAVSGRVSGRHNGD